MKLFKFQFLCEAFKIPIQCNEGVNNISCLNLKSNFITDAIADLTDVTLADEDTNSILTDNANRAIQGNVAMQVTQPGGKICH